MQELFNLIDLPAKEMQDYYNEHQIYLNDSICRKVDEIEKLLHSVFVDFDIAQGGEEYKPDPSGNWLKAFNELKDKWPPLKDELRSQFLKILNNGDIADNSD